MFYVLLYLFNLNVTVILLLLVVTRLSIDCPHWLNVFLVLFHAWSPDRPRISHPNRPPKLRLFRFIMRLFKYGSPYSLPYYYMQIIKAFIQTLQMICVNRHVNKLFFIFTFHWVLSWSSYNCVYHLIHKNLMATCIFPFVVKAKFCFRNDWLGGPLMTFYTQPYEIIFALLFWSISLALKIHQVMNNNDWNGN